MYPCTTRRRLLAQVEPRIPVPNQEMSLSVSNGRDMNPLLCQWERLNLNQTASKETTVEGCLTMPQTCHGNIAIDNNHFSCMHAGFCCDFRKCSASVVEILYGVEHGSFLAGNVRTRLQSHQRLVEPPRDILYKIWCGLLMRVV